MQLNSTNGIEKHLWTSLAEMQPSLYIGCKHLRGDMPKTLKNGRKICALWIDESVFQDLVRHQGVLQGIEGDPTPLGEIGSRMIAEQIQASQLSEVRAALANPGGKAA